ncbi:hypothetical protein BS50DRAFT_90101 [Corynespora cassiicola Philippines]|uniref:Rhodopsin domain-containing protein n=1 Tax=Corynespora cassiicola Philippines TaxID=1448308 RepID=A0A2T2NEG9_CORCC|nr:hypothetical protein BS50DRAFT_90101 [Corynespora cassiicola Philippines]
MGPAPVQIEEILKLPAMEAPPGATQDPNLPGRSHEQIWYYPTITLCMTIPGIFMILRYNAKLTGKGMRLGIADFFLILGFFLSIATAGTGAMNIRYGVAVHQWNLTLGTYFKLLYWVNIHQLVYAPTMLSIKIAIVLQYMSIFSPERCRNKIMHYGGWATIVANAMFYIIRWFLTLLSCRPRKKIWDKSEPGSCIRTNQFLTATGFVNAISDIIILILPLMVLWKLQLPRKKKFEISLLFATGLLACVASCLRIYYSLMFIIGDSTSLDMSYNIGWEGLWAYAEVALGIIVACSLSISQILKNSKIFSVIFSKVKILCSRDMSRPLSHVVEPPEMAVDGQSTVSRSTGQKRPTFESPWSDSEADLNREILVVVDIEHSSGENQEGVAQELPHKTIIWS